MASSNTRESKNIQFSKLNGERLKGYIAVVTGAGRGIGKSIALALAQQQCTIFITSRTQSELDRTVEEINNAGGVGHAVVANAMDRDDAKKPVKHAIEKYGRIDILVNNVGGGYSEEGWENHDPFNLTDASFESNILLNLTSCYWTTREALPHMKKNKFGRIITIGSGYAKRSGGGLAYSTAKHGLIGFTRSLAAFTARSAENLTINCLCPGWTNTSLVPKVMHKLAKTENLQRRLLEPDELGPMAVLLCSPESYGITGQVISVDGGYKL